jgi:Tfp pilus assembly protein PilZ
MEAELEAAYGAAALAPPPPPPPPPAVPSPSRAKVIRELTPGDDDDRSEDTDLFRKSAKGLSRLPADSLHGQSAEPTEEASRRKKPARLKLAYRVAEAMVAEYRENLRQGGCFVKADQPLPVGREVVIEVRAPGLIEPLRLDGVVTGSSATGVVDPLRGPGMQVRYRLDDRARAEVERTLAGLVRR